MNTPLRRVGIAIAMMFALLFLSSSYVQVIASEDIANDDRNVRKLYESFSAERGQILAGGIPIAESIPVDNSSGSFAPTPTQKSMHRWWGTTP